MASTPILLMTVGYEGRSPGELVELLRKNRVRRGVDVRQLPLSRKRGFSKTALAELLSSNGIEYSNPRELGTPPAIRNRYKKTEDYDAFKKQYLAHLAGQKASVAKLLDLAGDLRCCLLCFERDPGRCHRSILAQVLARRTGRALEVRHL